MKRKLFFDTGITGHHSEYIRYLVDYLFLNEDIHQYYFVVHFNFSREFPDIANKANQTKNITWIEITKKEHTNCQKGGLIKKSFSSYKLMNRYARKNAVHQVYLLNYNIFQFACAFYRNKYSIEGVLFSPFYRLNRNTWKEKINYLRKYMTTWLYTLNKNIESIYVLNDLKTVHYLNMTFQTNMFKMLIDPIPKLKPLSEFNIYKHYNIKRNKKIFLHFGSLGDRKGTFEILDSTMFINEKLKKDVTILLVGKVNDKKVEKKISHKINNNNSDVQIIWDNQFSSNEMMKSLFDQCFAVLMTYKKGEGSSGILGHAAAANKMVIATNKGLLGEIIFENKLGLLVNTPSPNEIADIIMASFNFELDMSYLEKFVLSHEESFFAEIILL